MHQMSLKVLTKTNSVRKILQGFGADVVTRIRSQYTRFCIDTYWWFLEACFRSQEHCPAKDEALGNEVGTTVL